MPQQINFYDIITRFVLQVRERLGMLNQYNANITLHTGDSWEEVRATVDVRKRTNTGVLAPIDPGEVIQLAENVAELFYESHVPVAVSTPINPLPTLGGPCNPNLVSFKIRGYAAFRGIPLAPAWIPHPTAIFHQVNDALQEHGFSIVNNVFSVSIEPGQLVIARECAPDRIDEHNLDVLIPRILRDMWPTATLEHQLTDYGSFGNPLRMVKTSIQLGPNSDDSEYGWIDVHANQGYCDVCFGRGNRIWQGHEDERVLQAIRTGRFSPDPQSHAGVTPWAEIRAQVEEDREFYVSRDEDSPYCALSLVNCAGMLALTLDSVGYNFALAYSITNVTPTEGYEDYQENSYVFSVDIQDWGRRLSSEVSDLVDTMKRALESVVQRESAQAINTSITYRTQHAHLYLRVDFSAEDDHRLAEALARSLSVEDHLLVYESLRQAMHVNTTPDKTARIQSLMQRVVPGHPVPDAPDARPYTA
jgi:hypothetical protein